MDHEGVSGARPLPAIPRGHLLSEKDADLNYAKVVGKRIRLLRIVRDLSQDELGNRAGVTRNYVSAVERGAQGLDVIRARRLAVALGVGIGELLADAEPGLATSVALRIANDRG